MDTSVLQCPWKKKKKSVDYRSTLFREYVSCAYKMVYDLNIYCM